MRRRGCRFQNRRRKSRALVRLKFATQGRSSQHSPATVLESLLVARMMYLPVQVAKSQPWKISFVCKEAF